MASTRVAIVTGAAQGIGRAIALKLADDGLDVAVNDIAPQLSKLNDVVEKIKAKGRNSVAVVADISKEDEVKNMIEKTVEILGGVDCVCPLTFLPCSLLILSSSQMIANAGIVPAKNPLDCASPSSLTLHNDNE